MNQRRRAVRRMESIYGQNEQGGIENFYSFFCTRSLDGVHFVQHTSHQTETKRSQDAMKRRTALNRALVYITLNKP